MYVTLYRSVPNTLLLIRRGVLGVHLLRYFYSVSDWFHGQGGTSGVSELACQLHDITMVRVQCLSRQIGARHSAAA